MPNFSFDRAYKIKKLLLKIVDNLKGYKHFIYVVSLHFLRNFKLSLMQKVETNSFK